VGRRSPGVEGVWLRNQCMCEFRVVMAFGKKLFLSLLVFVLIHL